MPSSACEQPEEQASQLQGPLAPATALPPAAAAAAAPLTFARWPLSWHSVMYCAVWSFSFFFNDPATTEIYTLSLHDALPISAAIVLVGLAPKPFPSTALGKRLRSRSEEQTSELQSRLQLVSRLLLAKKE